MVNQPKLNLACGQFRIDGYYGIDLVKMDSVDTQMNLELFPWEIESESAEDIICNHFVEHLSMDTTPMRIVKMVVAAEDFVELKRNMLMYLTAIQNGATIPSDGLILFMEEVYRILKPGGKIHITTPHYNTGIAWQDPTHKRAITEQTFMYFNKGWRERSDLSHYGITSDFKVSLEGYELYPDMNDKTKDEKAFSFRHLTNTIANMKVTCTKQPNLIIK